MVQLEGGIESVEFVVWPGSGVVGGNDALTNLRPTYNLQAHREEEAEEKFHLLPNIRPQGFELQHKSRLAIQFGRQLATEENK